jgi:DMSO/TMAO reductase YedYZ molybdopterin-dependent catalytic subunit
VGIVSPGFFGRRREGAVELPPGQYLTRDFPVLSAGATPRVPLDSWALRLTTLSGPDLVWDWAAFTALPAQDITVDLHCVTKWSKLGTQWRGVSLDNLLSTVTADAGFVVAECHGGYTTNLPVADLLGGKAWVAYQYDGQPLAPEHGGPARLLVPHLYFWKSAKWLRALRVLDHDEPGFWESLGYHNYGDPWREQRYWGD